MITRRALIRGAAVGATAIASARLPAWARPVAPASSMRSPDSQPFPALPAGVSSMPQIEHVVVLMMENHSFDNLLGMVAEQVPGRGGVDGLTVRRGRVLNSNPRSGGARVFASRAGSPCQLKHEPSQTWNASHTAYNGGRNDGFVRASGPVAMSFWDKRDLPFTYSLARHFPIGARYFSSMLGQTDPNRRFLFAATASGTINNDADQSAMPANGTIFDRLDANGIGWADYYQSVPTVTIIPGFVSSPARRAWLRKFDGFYRDVAAGKLPQFTVLEPNYGTASEENPDDIQVGERFIAGVVHALTHAPTWRSTALFITYDEHGGYYDHVPPPPALPPDSTRPMLGPRDVPGGYDRYGFRVPLIVVSPWGRRAHISRVVQDHTSLLAFVERKWNLPAMTLRDANADPMLDYFDFRRPAFMKPPALAAAPGFGPGLARCHAAGLHPPLPTSAVDG